MNVWVTQVKLFAEERFEVGPCKWDVREVEQIVFEPVISDTLYKVVEVCESILDRPV